MLSGLVPAQVGNKAPKDSDLEIPDEDGCFIPHGRVFPGRLINFPTAKAKVSMKKGVGGTPQHIHSRKCTLVQLANPLMEDQSECENKDCVIQRHVYIFYMFTQSSS